MTVSTWVGNRQQKKMKSLRSAGRTPRDGHHGRCLSCMIPTDNDWDVLSQSSSDGSGAIDDDNDVAVVGNMACLGRSATAPGCTSFSYHRLPDSTLRLSVLKLDGTSFEVKVGRRATVADLKDAVKDVFRDKVENDRGKISWALVWRHFCLCYGDCMLVDDKARLKDYGIRDDAQLCFMSLELTSGPIKKPVKKKQSLTQLNIRRSSEAKDLSEVGYRSMSMSEDVSPTSTSSQDEQYTAVTTERAEYKWVQLFRSFLSSTKLKTSPRKDQAQSFG